MIIELAPAYVLSKKVRWRQHSIERCCENNWAYDQRESLCCLTKTKQQHLNKSTSNIEIVCV